MEFLTALIRQSPGMRAMVALALLGPSAAPSAIAETAPTPPSTHDHSKVIGAYLDGVFPTNDPDIGTTQPPALLSQTHAFSNIATLTPKPGLTPYWVNSPLWSDGALKRRWVAVPSDGVRDTPTEKVVFSANSPWNFPAGTVAVKHFELATDATNTSAIRRLETRFLVVTENGFYGITYRWRPDGTDADLLSGSVTDSVTVTEADGSTRVQNWTYPSRTDCRSCHNDSSGALLGLKTYQINGDVTYLNETTPVNQLQAWEDSGIFSAALGDVESLPRGVDVGDTTAPLENRVHSYLATNCSNCHLPGNLSNDFDLRFETPLLASGIIDDLPLYDLGITDGKIVASGDSARSLMHFRVGSTDPLFRMPPIGRSLTDEVALQTLTDWIATLLPSENNDNPPTANDDEGQTLADTAISIETFGNDFDADGDAFSIEQTTQPTNGSVSWTNSGNAIYTPGTSFIGTDTFTYSIVDDGGQTSAPASVIISVFPASTASDVSFSDGSSLLPDSSNYSGVAMGVADMNQDGLDDIVHLNNGKSLFIDYQQPAGADFTRLSLGTPSSSRVWGMALGDADNNGMPDIISGGYYDGLQYFRANSEGTSYSKSSLNSPTVFLQAVNFADINGDGWLDIFACHDHAENAKWRNSGTGSMIADTAMMDTSTVPASDNSGNYGSVWTDYDGDGDLDLYISKCRAGVTSTTDPRRVNQLFRNDGEAGYTEVAAAAGLADGAQSWVADFADIDNDGDLDCFIGNHAAPSRLMRNNGDATFTETTLGSGISVSWRVIQSVFRDFNNDGWIDLLLAGEQHGLWLNDRDGTFTKAPNPFSTAQIESCAIGDLNHDGFPDVYAGYARIYNTPSITRPDKMFLSNPNSNGSITVSLHGRTSNRLASGALLELHGPWGIQLREVRNGEGYGVTHSFSQRFGLGNAATADKLVVRWPSGIVDTAFDLPANSFLTLEEGSTEPPSLQSPIAQNSELNSSVELQVFATDPTNDPLTYTATNLPTGLTIDPASGLIAGTTANTAGNFPVTVSVTDGWSVQSASFVWAVLATDPSPPSDDEYTLGDDTVALYHLNGGLSDVSKNALNLTASGNVSFSNDNLDWMITPTGSAVRFTNGGDSLTVNIPDNLILVEGDTRPITIEARIYPRAWLGYGNDDYQIVTLIQDSETGFGLEDSAWHTSPKGPRVITAGTPIATAKQCAARAPLDQWSHLKIVLEPAGVVSAWINGRPTGSVALNLNVDNTSDWVLTLGNFDGDIDEIWIHRGIITEPFLPEVTSTSTALIAEALGVNAWDIRPEDLIKDSDLDGFSNLFETALGSPPLDGAEASDIEPSYDSEGYALVSYSVPSSAKPTSSGYQTNAFRYSVEISDDLSEWSPGAVSTTTVGNIFEGFQPVTQRINLAPSGKRFFVRVKVDSQ